VDLPSKKSLFLGADANICFAILEPPIRHGHRQEDEQYHKVYISGYLAFDENLRFPGPERLYRLPPDQ
jgi:hypothetical protein